MGFLPLGSLADFSALLQNTALCPLSMEATPLGRSLLGGLQWGVGIWPPGKPGDQSFRAGLPMQDRQVPVDLCPGQVWGRKHGGLGGGGMAALAATAMVPKEKGQIPPTALVGGMLWGQRWPRIAMGKAFP